LRQWARYVTAPCRWSYAICGAPIDGETAVRIEHIDGDVVTCDSYYCMDRAKRDNELTSK